MLPAGRYCIRLEPPLGALPSAPQALQEEARAAEALLRQAGRTVFAKRLALRPEHVLPERLSEPQA